MSMVGLTGPVSVVGQTSPVSVVGLTGLVLVTTLPGARPYRVSGRSDWPCVGIL